MTTRRIRWEAANEKASGSFYPDTSLFREKIAGLEDISGLIVGEPYSPEAFPYPGDTAFIQGFVLFKAAYRFVAINRVRLGSAYAKA